jgi:hypothetical protein
MPTGVSTKSVRPLCPRCGYDQTGLIESWKESCPLVATCAECGYGFDPADALYPTRKRLPWLYEHAKHWWSVRCAVKTLLMLLWPPAFWKRVRPEHEVRVGRIAGFIIASYAFLGGMLLFIGLVSEVVRHRRWDSAGRFGFRIAPWPQSIAQGTREFGESLLTLAPYEAALDAIGTLGAFAPLAIFWLPVTFAFLAIPSEWAGTRLRGRHTARLLLYAALPYLLLPALIGLGSVGNGWYTNLYHLVSPQFRRIIPEPYDVFVPEWLALPVFLWLMLVWPPLYWFSAIRWGYSLPSTKRPFLIVLIVLLTPWALFLAFMGYHEFIA